MPARTGKKIDRSAHIGDAAIALVHTRVSQMGFVWHPRGLDAGVDGEIELRDPATGEVANRFLLVQSKGSDRPFPGETSDRFHYLCDDRDLDYWMRADVPVLLVCSHPSDGEAWWAHVQSWFADPGHRASGRIDFDKATQRFDATAATHLLSLADPHGVAHVPVALEKTETLTSNLLAVDVPATVYRARIAASGFPSVLPREDWIARDGWLYTWSKPEETALCRAIQGTSEAVPTMDWGAAGPDEHRALVRLLNNTLRQDVSADCGWSQDNRHVYFRATADLTPRKILSASRRPRLVFNPKQKKDGTGLSYCQHAALGWQFLELAGRWFCQLVPSYHYTSDGSRESMFAADLLSGIKRRERNYAVYQQTRMWAFYLRGEQDLLGSPDRVLGYGDLETFQVDRGLDDAEWSADGRTEGFGADEDDDLWRLFE